LAPVRVVEETAILVDLHSCHGHRICHDHGLASGHGNLVAVLLYCLVDLDREIYLSLNRSYRGRRRWSGPYPSTEIRRCPWALGEAEIASEIFGMKIPP
jgi:hypothetical protein